MDKVKDVIKSKMKPKKSVTIEEADNGYLVRTYLPEPNMQEKKMVCKDMDEVMEAVENMMGKKGKKKEEDNGEVEDLKDKYGKK